MRRLARERGFVLLLVLVILALAATVLAAAVRHSSRTALAALAAQERLRQRWARVSLHRFVQPRAERILQAAGADATRPWLARLEVELNGRPIRLVVADEQAKANLNALWARGRGRGVSEAARRLQQFSPDFLVVDLRPGVGGAAAVFESFAQVYADASPAALAGRADRPGTAETVTLWGDGRLNIRRAPAAVLRACLADVLSEQQIERLEQLRRERPLLSLEEFFQAIKAGKELRGRLATALTDRSGCHSLWLLDGPSDRPGARLYVWQTTGGARSPAAVPEKPSPAAMVLGDRTLAW